jgi:hypothetical protein
MAVQSTKLSRQRSALRNANDTGYDYEYIVVCEASDTLETAIAHSTVPTLGGSINGRYVAVVDWEEVRDGVGVFRARVSTSSSAPSRVSGASSSENPLLQPVTKGVRFVRTERGITYDQLGAVIANSAGTPYADVTIDDYDMVLWFRKNVATFDQNVAADAIGCVNAAPWRGWAAGMARVTDISAEYATYNGSEYAIVSTEITIRKGPQYWALRLVDEGPRDSAGNPPASATGDLIDGVENLDGSGNFVTGYGAAAVNEFDVLPTYNFAFVDWYTT